jgi:DUF971 family protein
MDNWPTELRLAKGGDTLHVAFADGRRFALPAEYLRVESPSAEVQGHGPGERRTVGGKRSVTIRGVEPVGHYAVRLVFDDGHDTGLYTWDALAALGAEAPTRWAEYLAQLSAKGLDRDRPGEA